MNTEGGGGIGGVLPRMITQVIFTVFTFAFGISPRELARRASGSSRAILRMRASVRGTLDNRWIFAIGTSECTLGEGQGYK